MLCKHFLKEIAALLTLLQFKDRADRMDDGTTGKIKRGVIWASPVAQRTSGFISGTYQEHVTRHPNI
jgi:hypothetical protein